MKHIYTLFLTLFILIGTGTAQAKKSHRPIRVSCIGNSITYGTGLEDPVQDSYPSQLQRLLGDGYQVGRFGKPGATLLRRAFRPYMEQEEYHQAMDFHGDIAVIHLGINDTDPRAWPNYRDEFVNDYCALIDSVRCSNPRCRVIIARMTPLSDRHHRFQSGTRDWHAQIQQAIETIAQVKGCQLIDFYEPLHPHPDLFPDAIHPNKEGYGIMAQVVYSAITGDYGGLRLPDCYTNHMVLPRERTFSMQGTANANAEVCVTIGDQRHRAVAGQDGKWSVMIQPLKSGASYTIQVSTKDQSITLTDVLAGEIWLCSGQSNMEFRLNQCATASQDIPASDNDQIRLLHMAPRWATAAYTWSESALDSVNHLQYYDCRGWQRCTPQSAAPFSAVGYYFARELQDSLHCPIGIIANAVGGSGIESWVDRETIEWEFPNILRDWTRNDFIQDWVRGRAVQNMGEHRAALQRHPYEPCYLYEAGIQPITPLPIQGVIWYQGESNAHNMDTHTRLFHLLLQSWRQAWHQPELPFYYVQLSSLNRPSWPWFRDSQRLLMQSEPHTGMAVSTDVGDSLDVHPRHKAPVGHRLAQWALHQTYGKTHITPSGPLFASATSVDGEVQVCFDYAEGLQTSDGRAPATFEVAEVEGLYHPATARIQGNRIVLTCPLVSRPRYVRYGWQPFTRANLVNAASLPASTFRGEIAQ